MADPDPRAGSSDGPLTRPEPPGQTGDAATKQGHPTTRHLFGILGPGLVTGAADDATLSTASRRRSCPRPRLTSRHPTLRPGRTTAGPWNPAHPARQPGRQARPRAEKRRTATTSSHQPKITKDRG
jgi:hypothetical protein